MPHSLSRERLDALLGAAPNFRVAVVGDAMLDVYLHGDVDRISPEAPVPVVRVRERREASGGAANVAQNILATGAGCEIICVVGRDSAGERLRDRLVSAGCADRGFVAIDRPTTTKTRILARSQQVVRFDEEDDADLTGAEAQALVAAAQRAVGVADALVLEDYNKGVLTPIVIDAAIDAAQRRGIPIVVDPKYRNFFRYRGATVFKPNRRELESALGAAVDLEHPEALPEVFHRLGVEHLLLTLGEHGMALLSSGGDIARIPTTAREVYDVVGAGDTVTAWLAMSLAAGATAREAAVIANFAAGIEVAKLGAATVSADEIREAWQAFRDDATAA